MRIVTSTSLAAVVAATLLAAGCGGGTPTTQPSMPISGANMTPPPTTEPTPATQPAMAGATHVLTQDEPYYVDVPNGGSVPAGVLKAGTPVLMMVPGATYCKVLSNQGKGCYTLTAGLKPIANK